MGWRSCMDLKKQLMVNSDEKLYGKDKGIAKKTLEEWSELTVYNIAVID